MHKISIVTPTYNQGPFIEDCIRSVLNQNYDNFEHIIVDGGSTDETISVLKKYPHLKWISEKDNGSVFALNKGIKLANGDIVGWLNSDDFYEENIFGSVIEEFENFKYQVICGNLNFVDKNKKLINKDSTVNFDYNFLTKIDPFVIRTPAAFYSMKILEQVNFYNELYKIVFDYELFVKVSAIEKIKFVSKTYSNYRYHESTLSANNVKTQVLELLKISRKNGRKITDPISLLLYKILFKNYIKRVLHIN
ncbi:MAG: glycosyltransferase [Ignavibacteria bacterium]|nr:glycosyltransferase [Ignavibacteria bacterium]